MELKYYRFNNSNLNYLSQSFSFIKFSISRNKKITPIYKPFYNPKHSPPEEEKIQKLAYGRKQKQVSVILWGIEPRKKAR